MISVGMEVNSFAQYCSISEAKFGDDLWIAVKIFTGMIFSFWRFAKGLFIKYVRKIFWKTKISYPLIRTCTILRKY